MQAQPEPQHHCPICGGHLNVHLGVTYYAPERKIVSSTYSIHLSPSEGVLFGMLWEHRARGPVTRGQLLDRLYGITANGGPETQDKVLSVHFYNIRQKLADAHADIDIVTGVESGHWLANTPAGRRARKVAA